LFLLTNFTEPLILNVLLLLFPRLTTGLIGPEEDDETDFSFWGETIAFSTRGSEEDCLSEVIVAVGGAEGRHHLVIPLSGGTN
jgi:hypothetical protein